MNDVLLNYAGCIKALHCHSFVRLTIAKCNSAVVEPRSFRMWTRSNAMEQTFPQFILTYQRTSCERKLLSSDGFAIRSEIKNRALLISSQAQ